MRVGTARAGVCVRVCCSGALTTHARHGVLAGLMCSDVDGAVALCESHQRRQCVKCLLTRKTVPAVLRCVRFVGRILPALLAATVYAAGGACVHATWRHHGVQGCDLPDPS